MRLFFNKKGDVTFTLQRVVEIIIGVIVLIALLGFLVTLIAATISKEPPAEENDFKRVLLEIDSLKKGSESIIIPIFSQEISFQLFKTPQQYKDCKKDSYCLCYFEEGKSELTNCVGSTLDPKSGFEVPVSSSNNIIKVENRKIKLNVDGQTLTLEKIQ